MGLWRAAAITTLALTGCGSEDAGSEPDPSSSGSGSDATANTTSSGSSSSGSSSSGSSSNGSSSDGSSSDGSSSDGSNSNGSSSGGSSSDGGSTSGGTTGAVAFGDPRSGEATYYAADGSGACMFDPSPDDLMVAALNAPDWSGSSWCGACARVDGPMGTVSVRIVDLCPECRSGDLDLSPDAFEQIAPLEQGRVGIDWTFVSCDVSGPIKYRYKDGTNAWWTAVQVLNHALPITSLEWSSDGSAFHPAERQDYNYFLDASGFGADPVVVRVTAIDGQILTDMLPGPEEYLVVDGEAQFE